MMSKHSYCERRSLRYGMRDCVALMERYCSDVVVILWKCVGEKGRNEGRGRIC